MSFLSYPEKIGFDKGFDKGKVEGFEQGYDKGFNKGFDLGFDKGYDKGKEAGRREEKRNGLLKGIELGLKLKFGNEGLRLLPAVQEQQDLAVLQKVFDATSPDTTLDDVRRLLAVP